VSLHTLCCVRKSSGLVSNLMAHLRATRSILGPARRLAWSMPDVPPEFATKPTAHNGLVAGSSPAGPTTD
jgi:hypothetical protein